jgi:hypothetical protein
MKVADNLNGEWLVGEEVDEKLKLNVERPFPAFEILSM